MSFYQDLIHEIAPELNPAGVEASMRMEYGTLNHLSRAKFAREARLAAACERQQPGYLRMIAASFGMSADYDRWESCR